MRLGGLFMRVKTVLWSLLLSYGLTGLFLLLLAFLLFQFELGEGAAAAGIVFIYVVSCLAGGFAAGDIARGAGKPLIQRRKRV